MPYPNEHAARLKEPGQYAEFRRENNKFGDGRHAIWGIKKKPRKVELQAVRFDAKKHTVAQAKKWLKDNGYKPILFEPASGGKKAMPFDNESFYRAFEFDRTKLDKEKREIALTFSSETREVERWFGPEILEHSKGAVDLKRLRSMGALLINHDIDQIAGPIAKAEIDEDERVGRAVVRFDDDEEGARAMRKVESGSLRGVSVRYQVKKYRQLKEGESYKDRFEGPAYVATRWEPIEISLTPAPADATVGVGRGATRSLDGIEIEQRNDSDGKEDLRMTKEELKALLDEMLPEMVRTAVEKALPKASDKEKRADASDATPEDAVKADRERYKKTFERAATVGKEALALKLAGEGKEPDEISDALFVELAKERGKPSDAVQPGGDDGGADIDKIDDETLARSIGSPAVIGLDDD